MDAAARDLSAARFARLAVRIERLVLAPEEVRDALGRVAGPLLRAIGWSPALSTAALSTLLESMRLAGRSASDRDEPALVRMLEDAIEELDANVARVERVCVVHDRAPIGHASWLSRLLVLTSRAADAVSAPEPEPRRAIAHGDPFLLLPPAARDAAVIGRADVLLRIAREGPETLGHRRALLEAARRVLLDAAAAIPRASELVGPRVAYVAGQIDELDRLQAAGVDPERGLLHQARAALRRGEHERLRACLVALDAVARRRGDVPLATLTARALGSSGGDPLDAGVERARASIERSAREAFGAPLLDRVREGIRRGRERAREAREAASEEQREILDQVEGYLGEEAEDELLSAALAVDGFFDVGGAATPVRVIEEERRREIVRHPAAELALVPARRVEDVKDAVLGDPRALLFQLAEGTLLARRFVEDDVRRRTRSQLATELRVYVADGSSSMLGPRARMRDALLVAELATLIARLRQPNRFLSPVLELRFFDRELGPIERVSTVEEALAAIDAIFATPRGGGTSIQRALLGSFEQIRERRATDPALSCAQIVLVTDGMAPVDEAAVRAARETAGELPIRVSIIALGAQNPALRALSAEQRARGERVFYHFVADEELARVCAGDLDRRLVVHASDAEPPSDELAALIEEMDALERARHRDRRAGHDGATLLDLEHAGELRSAADEIDLELSHLFADGERARLESVERDERALRARFDRWFPPRATSSRPDPLPGSPARDRLDLARALIASTTEVLDLLGGRASERRAESIAIFERLLLEHGLPPWTYAGVLRDHGAVLAEDLRALRAIVS